MIKRPFVPLLLAALVLAVTTAGCARVPKAPLVAAPLPVVAPPAGFYHAVAKGQTFYRIAKMYGMDADKLMELNGVTDPRTLEVGQRLWIPKTGEAVPAPAPAPVYVDRESIARIIGPRNPTSVWKTITVHHSATLKGNAGLFDRDHRRRHMGGLFYHFVIGNGSLSDDGEIERGWRWKKQVKANRAFDIQICLVGDFNRQEVTPAQYEALVILVRMLREQYGIPFQSIRRHGDIKGKATECPGRRFPFYRLLSELARDS